MNAEKPVVKMARHFPTRDSALSFYKILLVENLIFLRIHIVIEGGVILEFFFVGSHASDNRVLNLLPLTSDIGWFVCVTRTGNVVSWEWFHIKNFTVALHLVTSEVVEGSSAFDGLFPFEEFVGDIVHSLELWAFFFGVAKVFCVLDFAWSPFV